MKLTKIICQKSTIVLREGKIIARKLTGESWELWTTPWTSHGRPANGMAVHAKTLDRIGRAFGGEIPFPERGERILLSPARGTLVLDVYRHDGLTETYALGEDGFALIWSAEGGWEE